MNIDKIELLWSESAREKYMNIQSFENCDKCEYGILLFNNQTCECSEKVMLECLLNVPAKYNVNIELSKTIQKEIKHFNDNSYLVLTGEDKYVKLLAFYIAKQVIQKNSAIVQYMITKEKMDHWKTDDNISRDITVFHNADLILFEDVYKNRSDMLYTSEIIQRIGRNQQIIFIGKTKLIDLKGDDYYEIEVESSDIKIVDEKC
jgi:hypothetical protein